MLFDVDNKLWSIFRSMEASPAVNIFGTLLTISLTLLTFTISLSQADEQSFYVILLLSLFSTVLLTWIFGREFSLSRKQKYANITSHLDSITLAISDLTLRLAEDIVDMETTSNFSPRIDDEKFQERITDVLTSFCSMFELLTSTNCRSAIKIVKTDPSTDTAWVVCFARDARSSLSNRDSDNERSKNRFDIIEKNSDYNHLLNKKVFIMTIG